MYFFVHCGHDLSVDRAWFHQDVLSICSGESNQGLSPSVKTGSPPGVDRTKLSCLYAISGIRVLIVYGFHDPTEEQLHVSLNKTRVKWTKVAMFVIHAISKEEIEIITCRDDLPDEIDYNEFSLSLCE